MKTGPKGGTTTRTHTGMQKKGFWLPTEDAEALRDLSYELRLTESDIIRAGIKAAIAGEVELAESGAESGGESGGAA